MGYDGSGFGGLGLIEALGLRVLLVGFKMKATDGV